MSDVLFYLGLDDTDAPEGMCTTWLGTLLAQTLQKSGMMVLESRLVRLNPTIPYKTRGNAAICLQIKGDPAYAFMVACEMVSSHAVLSCQNTHPGIVVSLRKPPSDFYLKAVTDICSIEEAKRIISEYALYHQEYKLGRGLIGATAALCSEFSDFTWEFLAYRKKDRFLVPRIYDADSFFLSEELTSPKTWDTWDYDEARPVCIPHSPDPVLYGIRGDSPFSVAHAASVINSEPYDLFRIWKTNQGTDAHLVLFTGDNLHEGVSYFMKGTVLEDPVTKEGGHVSFRLQAKASIILCMAFEPTKKFRDYVRLLRIGDVILAAGSFLRDTLNLEKFFLYSAEPYAIKKIPVCPVCDKRMTSAGSGKGYKCRSCGHRERTYENEYQDRAISQGWYEVPPGSRRHLSRPLKRGFVPPDR